VNKAPIFNMVKRLDPTFDPKEFKFATRGKFDFDPKGGVRSAGTSADTEPCDRP